MKKMTQAIALVFLTVGALGGAATAQQPPLGKNGNYPKTVLGLLPAQVPVDGDWKLVGILDGCGDDGVFLAQHWRIATSGGSITVEVGPLGDGAVGVSTVEPHQLTGSLGPDGVLALVGPQVGDEVQGQLGCATGSFGGELFYIRGKARMGGQWGEPCPGEWQTFHLFGVRGAPAAAPADLSGDWRFRHELFRKYTPKVLPVPKPYTGAITHVPGTGKMSLIKLQIPGQKTAPGVFGPDHGVIVAMLGGPVKSDFGYMAVASGDEMSGFGWHAAKKPPCKCNGNKQCVKACWKKQRVALFAFTAKRIVTAPEAGQVMLENDTGAPAAFLVVEPSSGAAREVVLPADARAAIELPEGAWLVLFRDALGLERAVEIWLQPGERQTITARSKAWGDHPLQAPLPDRTTNRDETCTPSLKDA